MEDLKTPATVTDGGIQLQGDMHSAFDLPPVRRTPATHSWTGTGTGTGPYLLASDDLHRAAGDVRKEEQSWVKQKLVSS